MSWKNRGQEQDAMEGLVKVLVAGLVLCAAVGACTIHRMEQMSQKSAEQLKREKIQNAAMIQLRWESAAKAKMGVKP